MYNTQIEFTHINGTPIVPAFVVGFNDVSGDVGGSYTRTLESDASGAVQTGYSQSLTFYGEAFFLIKANLIQATTPHLATIEVRITDLCCNQVLFTGEILGSAVKWCEGDCECEVSFVEKSAQTEFVRCLRETMIWDRKPRKFAPFTVTDGEDEERRAPYFNYCLEIEPTFLQLLVLALMALLMPIAVVVSILIAGVNGVITAINAIIGVIAAIVGVLNDIIAFINTIGGALTPINFGAAPLSLVPDFGVTGLQYFAVGCGYHHKAPFVRSYLKNACEICGLTFESSLFDNGGHLYQMTRLDAETRSAEVRAFDVGAANLPPYIEAAYIDNRPNMNALQLLITLADLNVAWWILPNGQGGHSLHIERKDWQPTNNNWFNTYDLPKDAVLRQCYDFGEGVPPAFGIYDYSNEGEKDGKGNIVARRWTDSVVDWNTPPNAGQRGVYQKTLPYSAALFRRDANRDDFSPFDGIPGVPFFAAAMTVIANLGMFGATASAGVAAVWNLFLGEAAVDNPFAMILTRHTVSMPKLLWYDGVSDINHASVSKIIKLGGIGLQFWFNHQGYIKRGFVTNGTPTPTLYDVLFEIDDPRSPNYQKQRRLDLSISFDECSIMTAAEVGKTIGFLFDGVPTTAVVREIVINPYNLEININATF